jgi:hypothetical protein
MPVTGEPPPHLKEHELEWPRATCNGSLATSSDHAQMLDSVKLSVFYTHCFRSVDPQSAHRGHPIGRRHTPVNSCARQVNLSVTTDDGITCTSRILNFLLKPYSSGLRPSRETVDFSTVGIEDALEI